MRVLQICHSYDPPFLDCARQYASLFAGTGYQVSTVYLTGQPSIEVERGSCSDEVIFLGYSSRQLRGLKLGAINAIRKIAVQAKFNFCIAHRSKPTYIALFATKLPVVSVHHAFGDFERLSRRLLVNLFRSRLLLLGVSNAVRDDMRGCLPGWPYERIETLYNRIDVQAVQSELWPRQAARETLGVPQDAWVVANVGRLHPDKDQTTLIRAFAIALPDLPPDSLLIIIGKGPLERSLKQLALELEVSRYVHFAGQVPHARRYFKAFDAFALTSDHEPFGMVLLEAMAAGVPVVCSDCGGGAEVVRNVGTLFPLGNTYKLAAALISISSGKIEHDNGSIQNALGARFTDDAARARFRTLSFVKGLFQQI